MGLRNTLAAMAILAGVWTMLSPLFLFLPVYETVSNGSVREGNAFDTGQVGQAMSLLGPSAAAGIGGLVGTRLLLTGAGVAWFYPGRWLMGLAAAALLVLSVFSATTLGPVILPPALLLVFPALWLAGPTFEGGRMPGRPER